MYDVPMVVEDPLTKMVLNALSQHPMFNENDLPLQTTSTVFIKEDLRKREFPKNGDGWLETYWGKDADTIIRECRKMRRHDKDNRDEYDETIGLVRQLKAMEVEATINNLSWAEGMESVIKQMGLSDRSLKALRKFGENRSVSLQKACHQFLKANTVLQMLNDKVDWDENDQQSWVDAMQLQKDARKMWQNVLHQVDTLNKAEQDALYFAAEELQAHGHLSSRELLRRGADTLDRNMTAQRMGALLKMYGEELNIFKSTSRGDYVLLGRDGFIIKDIWAYMAGSLDSDGSIFISERGDPRVTFVASGDSGKQLCEDLHKATGCGRLVTDQKVSHNTKKSVHRLIFSRKDDIRRVLKATLPHMMLKTTQARAMLSYVDEDDFMRKQELYR
ncbi:MAG: hypothetical protein VW518_06235, partial [Burkholderiaceae bacterium]